MGRELRRKQAKKEGKSLVEEKIKKDENPYNDIYKLLKTFGVILVIVLAIHFFTALVITKEIEWFSKDDDAEDQTNSVADSILAKNTFMQAEEEYYVYFYDFNNEDSSISSLISGELSGSKVYKVDTSDAFNSNYVTEEELGNSSANSIDNLKVINPTIIKVSGGSIVEYSETVDGVTEYLQNK